MRLNKEELITAGVLTAIVTPPMWWALTIPSCAFLWALSGSESRLNSKLFRRFGVPLVWAVSIFNYWAFAVIPISFGFLTLGYGIPDESDEGSLLGRLAINISRGNTFIANLITRSVIYIGAIVPFLVVRIFWLKK